jgi:hypothetical protein
MNQLPHDALARTTIHAPPIWQALQQHRLRRRRAQRAALLVAALALIIAAPGPGWWDLERGANVVAALVLVPAAFACCELIERLIFSAVDRITPRAVRRAVAPASGPVGGSLTMIHETRETWRGQLEQIEQTRGHLTLSERA